MSRTTEEPLSLLPPPVRTDTAVRRRAIRRMHREGRTLEWLASHFGLPMREVRDVVNAEKKVDRG